VLVYPLPLKELLQINVLYCVLHYRPRFITFCYAEQPCGLDVTRDIHSAIGSCPPVGVWFLWISNSFSCGCFIYVSLFCRVHTTLQRIIRRKLWAQKLQFTLFPPLSAYVMPFNSDVMSRLCPVMFFSGRWEILWTDFNAHGNSKMDFYPDISGYNIPSRFSVSPFGPDIFHSVCFRLTVSYFSSLGWEAIWTTF
jgi:hypothetical protein